MGRLGVRNAGVFRGRAALGVGVTRKQLGHFCAAGIVERLLPDTYRVAAVEPSPVQRLHAALLWAGDCAGAAGRSAGATYELAGVAHADRPEITVPRGIRARTAHVTVHHFDRSASMLRDHHGVRITGPECTLLTLGHALDGEAFEIACEDARRRRLTSLTALNRYLDRHGHRGRPGVAAMRQLLGELDPVHPSRSALEVKARRILVANGLTGFEREHPLEWNGRTYRFDFAFLRERTILETNGRRWHDDAADYEHDNEKWSVPGHHGYRLLLATWEKVLHQPHQLVAELKATFAA